MENPTLHFLVISDIHKEEAWNWLKSRIQQEIQNEKFDYIINAGDFTFISYDKPQPIKEKEEKIQLFYSIKKDIESFGIPHLYVPGNHDPEGEFTISEVVQGPSMNIHKQCIQLLPHLWIVGCGGSVPNRLADHSLFSQGYPHINSDMKEGIASCLNRIPPTDHILVLTHNPPSTIGSSFMDYKKHSDFQLWYGSDILYQELCESMQNHNIPLWIHGHVHHEPGMNWIHRSEKHCCIVNPGAALGGRYAKIRIQRIRDEWRVVSVQHSFDYE